MSDDLLTLYQKLPFPKSWNIYENTKISSKYHLFFHFLDLKKTVFSIVKNVDSANFFNN